MTALTSYSMEERDELLSRIPFVDKPKVFPVYGECATIGDVFVVNYSQFYEMLSSETTERFPFPKPQSLRSGDMVSFGGYRGVGSYYALWLKKDLVSHDEKFVRDYEAMIKSFSPAKSDETTTKTFNLSDYPLSDAQWKALARLFSKEEWWENWESKFKMICDCDSLFTALNEEDSETLLSLILQTHSVKLKRKRAREETLPPTRVSRDAPGPQDDPQQHVYLFVHSDEMGYYAPSAFSSVPFDYFPREYCSIVVDPLLTHSQSYYGQLLLSFREGEDENEEEDEEEDEDEEDDEDKEEDDEDDEDDEEDHKKKRGNITKTSHAGDAETQSLDRFSDKLVDCDRFYHEGKYYSLSEATWVDLRDGASLIGSVSNTDNYFALTRALFEKHFDFLTQSSKKV